MKWKSLASWMKRSDLGRDNKETNKTIIGEELLEKSRQGESWTHWHQKRKRPLKTLTPNFQKLETSFEKKMPKNPKSWLSQVEMFRLGFFPNWVVKMMLYGRKGFYLVSSI